MEPCAREMEQEGCSVWAKGVGEGGRWSESMWAICSLRRDPEAEPPTPLGLRSRHRAQRVQRLHGATGEYYRRRGQRPCNDT